MFKKLLTASAVSMVLAGAALAQSSPGFESGTAGWTPTTTSFTSTVFGPLNVQAYDSFVTVVDDYTNPTPTPYDYQVLSAGAEYGNSFGVLNTGSLSNLGYRINLLSTPAANGDKFALQLFSFDADTANGFVDSAKVSFYQGGTELSNFTALSDNTFDLGDGNGPQSNGMASFTGTSGWYQFFVPVGTTSIEVSLANGGVDIDGNPDKGNQPLVALDYAAVTPVPEPESLALMMAGLGAVGFMSRRRKARATQ